MRACVSVQENSIALWLDGLESVPFCNNHDERCTTDGAQGKLARGS